MAMKRYEHEIDENGVGNVNRGYMSSLSSWGTTEVSLRVILIPIIILLAFLPAGFAQTIPQLTLTLIGNGARPYVTPAGQTTELKMEILNVAPSDVYLLEGDAYLDPGLNGSWELAHSEGMGNFHLGYLQSAIWTFDLAIPAKIQAANLTNGTPEAILLIKIRFLTLSNLEREEQGEFALSVPGAAVQQQNSWIWLVVAGVIAVTCVGVVAFRLKQRKRRTS
jgi:hypothetical protein